MSAKKLGVIAIVSTVCFSAICIATFRFRVQPRVEYTYHLGNDPTEVDLVFCLPTKDLQSVPETVIRQEFKPQALLCLRGTVERASDREVAPVIIAFYEQRTDKKNVIAGTATAIPDKMTGNVEILVNTPVQPGRYTLIAEWLGGQNYIARSILTVLPKQ